jgi:hypothetical protein
MYDPYHLGALIAYCYKREHCHPWLYRVRRAAQRRVDAAYRRKHG